MQIQKIRFLPLVVVIAGLFILLANNRSYAEPLTFDLADDHVNITSGFTGAQLVIFGNKTEKGDVVVVLEGPRRTTTVRKKDQILGAWINRSSLAFEDIPSYYDYAMSVDDETKMLSDDLLKEKNIGFSALKVVPRKSKYKEGRIKEFQDAMLRNKQDREFYPLKATKVSFLSEALFRVDFKLPSAVPSGDYNVRAFLVRDGSVVYEQIKPLRVGLVGFDASVYKLAHHNSFLYGVFCVLMAGLFGWLSNVVVRRT